jgi:hypothetical protein
MENETQRHLSLDELTAGLAEIRRSPADSGVLQMIVRRLSEGSREVLAEGELDEARGLIGDRWSAYATIGRNDQLTVMNARVIALLAQDRRFWPLAGDQLYVDLDLSLVNLPPGTRLAIGSAVIEASPDPHTGCRKFRSRYGLDAVRFVGSTTGKALQLRGINAMVVVGGKIRVGDTVRKIGVG